MILGTAGISCDRSDFYPANIFPSRCFFLESEFLKFGPTCRVEIQNFLFMLLRILAFSCFLICIGCDTPPETEPEVETTMPTEPPLRFTTESFEMADDPACATDEDRVCATVSLRYPFAQGGPEGVADRINDSLLLTMLSPLGMYEPSSPNMELRAAVDTFIREFREFRAEFPDSPAGWSVEAEGEVLYENEELVTVQLNVYSYLGGAHPNTYVYVQSFDKQTGEPLTLDRLYPGKSTLEQEMRAGIRAARPRLVGENQTLEDAGFFWDGGFIAPTSFGVIGDSVYFYYNPYEIAAYAVGHTSFKLARN